jgi:hypothetical protein
MDEARALAQLQEVLKRPEFDPPPVNFWDIFWSAVGQLVFEFLDWVFSPVSRAMQGHYDLLELALLAGSVVVICAGAWFLFRTIHVHMLRDSRAFARAAAQRRARSDSLWQEAHVLARAGQYTEAVRALYLSALYALEEHDVLAVQEALTNREHAERLSHARPGAGALFASVVQRYDRLRYGGFPADAAAFDDLSALVSQVRDVHGGAMKEAAPPPPAAPVGAAA